MTSKMKNLLLFLAILFVGITIISCDKDDPKLPAIDGYNNAGEVASSKLVAYFPLDGNGTEQKKNIAPAESKNATYVTGIKGKAVQLDKGYMTYPALTQFASANDLGSVTVSAWIKTENNTLGATCVFALTQDLGINADWNHGPVTMYLENGKPLAYNDTLVLHGAVSSWPDAIRLGADNINDYGEREKDFLTVKTGGNWVQYILKYDGAASTLDLYANGKLVSNNNFRLRESAPGVPLGPLKIKTPVRAVIGAFPTSLVGYTNSPIQTWQQFFTGGVDEIRVFNGALTNTEILALYKLELAGR